MYKQNNNREFENKGNTEFGLIRHGETLWNIEKRVQGQKNSPLSENGIKMAETWGQILKNRGYDRILASDLGRTMETAAVINKFLNVSVSEEKKLREMDWGSFTGKIYRNVKKGSPDIVDYGEMEGWDFHPSGGESRRSVYARSAEALKGAAKMWPNEKILVVTHEGVIHCIVNFLKNRKFIFSESMILKPFHVHNLICSGNGLSILKLNAINLKQQ